MGKKGDTGGEISEDIVLELRTNFEAELKRSAAQYSTFQKKAGDVSRSLEQNVNSMFRQVSGNLSSMMNGVQRTVVSSVNMTRGAMREIMADSVKLSQTYENYVRRSEVIKKGMLDTLDRIPKASGKMAAINAWQNVGNPFDKETIRAASDMYQQLGNISQKASTNILQATQNSLNSVKQLVAGTKDTLVDLEVAVNNKGTLESALSAKSGIESIEKQLKSGQEAIKDQAKRVVAAEKEVQNARLAMSKQTDDKLKQQQQGFFQQAVQNLTKVQKAYHDTEKEVSKLAYTFEEAKKRISKEISAVVTQISNSTQVKNSKGLFEHIDKSYTDLSEKYKKLANTKLLKKEVVEQFKADVRSMNESIHAYNVNLKNLRENIHALEKLHKAGLAPNAAPLIKERKEQLKELEANVKQITAMSNKATNQSELLARRQSKSLFALSWEMVRNFRWQVAGLLYLATKATSVIKNTFFKVLNDIQKFRTDAMAIAASITYSMIGDVSTNFNKAFEYSKDLMMKLEMEAAKTILTLEDMTMLTKTFVQAGIIPNTDEDIKKISTIGTAIKILTEGMANAGVQMRQELYAIIQGRQRATDQVAMMFKMIGININDVLKKAKKEGKDLLDVLSEALAPFNEVNKAMAHDYEVQKEALEKIFDKIKRIGADNAYWRVSNSLSEINNKLADANGNLTNFGLGGAKILGVLMESMRLTIVYISQMSSIFTRGSETADKLIDIFAFLAHSLGLVAIAGDAVGVVFENITLRMAQAFYTAREIAKGPFGYIEETFDYYNQLIAEAWDSYYDRSGDLSVDIENTIANLRNLKNLSSENQNIFDKFKIPKPETADYFDGIGKKIHQVTKQSLEGLAKINYEYKTEMDELADYEAAYLKKKEVLVNAISSGLANKEELKSLQEQLNGTMEILGEAEKYRKALGDRKAKAMRKEYDDERNKIEQVKAEYENLLESFEVKPKTPFEELGKKYDKLTISLEHFIAKNKKALSNNQIKTLWDTFEQGVNDSIDDINENFENVYQSFYDSMSSHRVMNPLQAIDNEFDKIVNNITKSTVLMDDPTRRAALLAELEIMKQERITLAELTFELEKQEALAQAKKSHADILKQSIRPIDQQRAAIMDLEAEYKSSSANIQKKIDEIEEKWRGVEMHPIIKEQINAMKQDLENLGIVFENTKNDVMEPFWKDMKDMSQGWADGLADVLNEAAFNLDSFKEGFRGFITDIAREISRAWIKRNITDQLMNLLPDLTGQKDENGEDTKKPQQEIFSLIEKGWEKLSDVFEEGFEKFKEITKEGFDLLKNGLSFLFESIKGLFSGNSYSFNETGGIMGTLSSIGSFAMGLMGMGGSSDGGSVTAEGSTLTGGSGLTYTSSNFDFSMADGGLIEEPIIGRGLRTGASYQLGEAGDEYVIPKNKMNSGGLNSLSINVPVNISGGTDNKLVARLKDELRRSVEETTLRVIKEHV